MVPRTWWFNGRRYWQLEVDGAEVVASTVDGYWAHYPPLSASFEVYRVKDGLSSFLGYAEGTARERLAACFREAFTERAFHVSRP